jgi:hypothetical protein
MDDTTANRTAIRALFCGSIAPGLGTDTRDLYVATSHLSLPTVPSGITENTRLDSVIEYIIIPSLTVRVTDAARSVVHFHAEGNKAIELLEGAFSEDDLQFVTELRERVLKDYHDANAQDIENEIISADAPGGIAQLNIEFDTDGQEVPETVRTLSSLIHDTEDWSQGWGLSRQF